jgi:hypothetical protein
MQTGWRRFLVALVAVVAVGVVAVPASAGVKVVFRDPGHDLLYIHGHLMAYPANPTPGLDIAQYGATWEFRKYASATDQYGTLVYSVTLAPGACVIRGNACKFTDKTAKAARLGLASVKVSLKTNKTWMRAYGDLRGADAARLGFLITVHSPGDPTWSHSALFKQRSWGWQLRDSCWNGCA